MFFLSSCFHIFFMDYLLVCVFSSLWFTSFFHSLPFGTFLPSVSFTRSYSFPLSSLCHSLIFSSSLSFFLFHFLYVACIVSLSSSSFFLWATLKISLLTETQFPSQTTILLSWSMWVPQCHKYFHHFVQASAICFFSGVGAVIVDSSGHAV